MSEHEAKKKQPTMVSTSTQTDKVATYVVSEEELTSATVNSNYWRVRAEECTARYHETLLLNHDLRKRMEHYKGLYEMSQTLLQESRDMVEVLKEVLGDAEGAAKNAMQKPGPSKSFFEKGNKPPGDADAAGPSAIIKTEHDTKPKTDAGASGVSYTLKDTKPKTDADSSSSLNVMSRRMYCGFPETVQQLFYSADSDALFELFARVIKIHANPSSKNRLIVVRGTRGPVLKVLYFSNDNVYIEDLALGKWVRCVGVKMDSHTIRAFSIRYATPEELSVVRRLTYLSDQAVQLEKAKDKAK